MLLKEIKPTHFGFYKKKAPKTDLIVELYSKDDLICDVNVLKTISKYSKEIIVSRKCRDFVLVYNEKTLIKFKPSKRTCYDIKKIYKKFVNCQYLDYLIINVEGLFYSMSRLNQWNYSVNLYLSLENNYKDYSVEEVFDEPSWLLCDVYYIKNEIEDGEVKDGEGQDDKVKDAEAKVENVDKGENVKESTIYLK
ncbi:hypothetical protein NBO_28g0080 [Nosema bombycis CQ1]|uniref:Uncharacterized protein n=1 Tax=Nosema bombycis (strain CQ1 / CVCC 102059) TaxID=578461 RepID=R0KUE1_NOSB1|nr:hypothetical protein NBO_28g0080 [Nosema bombycis CQ1]|eukprot:EOB14441.1 hypothetical protein NBO_28g0080 [Nosema bombycis CQ1]